MIVLGVDPGYRNLGLSIVKISADGKAVKVLYSENMSVGKATAPMLFTKFLWPALLPACPRRNFAAGYAFRLLSSV